MTDWESRRARALEARIRELTEWQPMETAPRDGTPILGVTVMGDHYIVTQMSWRAYHPNAAGKISWRDAQGHKLNPDMWMPMMPGDVR